MTDIRNSRSAVIQKTTVLGNSLNFQEKNMTEFSLTLSCMMLKKWPNKLLKSSGVHNARFLKYARTFSKRMKRLKLKAFNQETHYKICLALLALSPGNFLPFYRIAIIKIICKQWFL